MEISIRRVTIKDAERLLEIYSYYVEKTAISFEYQTPIIEDFKKRIHNITSKYPYLVVEVGGKIEGYAYASSFIDRAAYDRSCEMTIYLDIDVRRIGLGRMLYEALERELKKMGMLNLYACIGYPAGEEDEFISRNSADFHEHMGYTLCGTFNKCGYKFGRWYNMIWMEKIIGDHK